MIPAPTPKALARAERRLARLLGEIDGDDSAPALTAAVRPDGYPIAIVCARRYGLASASILTFDEAATLTDAQLREEIAWMVEHAISEIDEATGGGAS
ncbi:MAG: hypothetical protein ACHREM_26190 [Polyangiales bacterium]